MPSFPAVGVLALLLIACPAPASDPFTDPRAGDALRAELDSYPDGPVTAVHRLWTAYLESKADGFDCGPSDYWLASEQGTWTTPDGREYTLCYDLAGAMLGARREYAVLRIDPVPGTGGTEYSITTLFPAGDIAGHDALVTVFAVREGDDWKLAGALGRLTRTWRQETVGRFTYIIRPGHVFSRERAQAAVAFADSLADAFGVPRIRPLRYYVVADADAMLHVMGYRPDTTYGGAGGRSLPGIIISGDPAFGEKHGHEIAHHVIQPLQGPRLHIVASEGVPTWLGGTRGMHYPDALLTLRAWLEEHPAATLDSVLADNGHPMHNPAAALLSAMVYEQGGVDAIRRFLDSGPTWPAFRAGVEEIFGASWKSVADEWRRRAMRVDSTVEDRQIGSPGSDLVPVLPGHHSRDLREVTEVVCHPGREQLPERDRAEGGVLAFERELALADLPSP